MHGMDIPILLNPKTSAIILKNDIIILVIR